MGNTAVLNNSENVTLVLGVTEPRGKSRRLELPFSVELYSLLKGAQQSLYAAMKASRLDLESIWVKLDNVKAYSGLPVSPYGQETSEAYQFAAFLVKNADLFKFHAEHMKPDGDVDSEVSVRECVVCVTGEGMTIFCMEHPSDIPVKSAVLEWELAESGELVLLIPPETH